MTTTPSNEQPLEELIERVRAATGPDRELDALLHAIVADQRTVRENMHPEFGRQLLARHSRPPHDEYWLNHPATVFPAYTASIDAALALVGRVRPGWLVSIDQLKTGWLSTLVEFDREADLVVDDYDAEAPTAPLAILHVLLLSLQSEADK